MEIANNIGFSHCPNSLSLQHFVKTLGINVNRRQIRDGLKQSSKYPLVSIGDISRTLETINVQSSAFKAKPDILPQLDSPFIAHYEKSDTKYFAVVEDISPKEIYYYTPEQGYIKESMNSFLEKWTGVIMVADTPSELDQKEETDIETLEAKAYYDNMVNIIPDFLEADECHAIIEYLEDRSLFQRSEVVYADGKRDIINSRSSFSATLSKEDFPLYGKIQDKVAELLNVPVSHIEELQCVRYAEGQEFRPHFDSSPILHRKHTFLIYLNDDFDGGETYFPELFTQIKPKRGNALHFIDQDEEGNNIPYSYHSGLPIRNGIKYACNIWVRDRPVTNQSL